MALKIHGYRCFIPGALLKPRQNGLACMLIPVQSSGPDATMECVPVLRSTARDVGYTLPAAFLQKYRRFEATFKDVHTMVQGPHVNQFNIPDARALEYMPPRMAEAVRGLYNNPAARDPRVVAARPPPHCDVVKHVAQSATMERLVFIKFNVLLVFIINLQRNRSRLPSSKPPAHGSGFDDKKVPLQ